VVTEDYFIPSRAMSVYRMYDVLVMHWHDRSTRISFRATPCDIYIMEHYGREISGQELASS
jgi:hypothetical protein